MTIRHRLSDALRGLPALCPLALALIARRPRSMLSFLAEVWRAYRTAARLCAPDIMPHDLLGRRPVTMHMGQHDVFPGAPGLLVVELVAALAPRRVFEIGTYKGGLAALMAMNMPGEGKIFTLDLPPEGAMPEHGTDRKLVETARTELGVHFRGTEWDGTKIVQLYGNSKTFDFSPYYGSMDLVVIDASHSHEFVFNDSMQAFRMIRSGGVLLWHDYESARSEYGVTWFVDRLRRRHGCPVHRLPGGSQYAVLRVDESTKHKLDELARRPESF